MRLQAAPGSPEFLVEYTAALAAIGEPGKPQNPGKGTLSWLVREYFTSRDFKALAPSSKYQRRGMLEALCEQHGDKPYKLLEPRHIKKLRDEKVGPGTSNNLLKALRRVFAWAVDAELLSRNPAAEVSKLRYKTQGHHSWTVEEVRQFEAAHRPGTTPRLALALLLYTGARRSDVVRFGPDMVKDGWLTFRAKKTSAPVTIPLSPALIAELPAVKDGTYLRTSFGKPYVAEGFGNAFRDWCNAAGLPHCTAHGLRKAGAALAAERGATDAELEAIFGWGEGSKEPGLYRRAAQRRKLSERAAQLISLDENCPKN